MSSPPNQMLVPHVEQKWNEAANVQVGQAVAIELLVDAVEGADVSAPTPLDLHAENVTDLRVRWRSPYQTTTPLLAARAVPPHPDTGNIQNLLSMDVAEGFLDRPGTWLVQAVVTVAGKLYYSSWAEVVVFS